jgi:hypothetical protein
MRLDAVPIPSGFRPDEVLSAVKRMAALRGRSRAHASNTRSATAYQYSA